MHLGCRRALITAYFGMMALGLVGTLAAPGPAAAQAKLDIKMTRSPSVIYMPCHLMEDLKLVEKHAAALGVPGVKVEWVRLNGGAATDALLSNNVDVVDTGSGLLLLAWDRTKGGVKGIVATSALPLVLVSRNPNIKSLKDFKETDRIAVPTLHTSVQSVLLSIAAAKQFGDAKKFHPNQVLMAHPEGAQAMMNSSHEVTSHFSAPPYFQIAMKANPAVHVVTTAEEILGSPITNAAMFTTTKFAEANPKIMQAIRLAHMEAFDMIRNRTRDALEIYKRMDGDKTAVDELVALLQQPGMMGYDPKPQGTMKFADHLFATGVLKTKPSSWKDYYLDMAHDLDGS
jgi:NitT/TauT family transport system substrate-binding protein